ncbi:wall-associated receptor kinase-like 8 isoform X1 [Salvia hispanica]|uniref:wall-associated receptor kinase-like 8 isoform X1 n=1 Tax=Salvia hispanica TaxID=49212 RepID=UPI0020095330|nr:wall-associated receptor kinase-like 8 isoform X1 [Salvia hispanica]XP_047968080.1 wall-associated receptor kinase-like 8 isoform X1 [Salvia hispanica]XP_047968081.1 wall-associated receptor kinase-like 8 isoform X1 [Salvia hispanica]XP_047968082.1 wall-associated receptor kinase-like 8 isoform X1 [Salvia hispanica]
MRFPFITLSVFSWLSLTITAISLSKPGCPEKCGNVTIPYPFGVGSKCSAKCLTDSVDCEKSHKESPYAIICQNSSTPFLSIINMEVVKISLYGTLIVKLPVSPMNCLNMQTTVPVPISLRGSPFTIPAHYNSFVVLGCKNSVWLRSDTMQTVGGCTAICDANSTDTSCSGVNCCQTTLPERPQEFQYTYRSIEASNRSRYCGYAFPADKKWIPSAYTLHSGLNQDLLNPYDAGFRFAQLVIDWERVGFEDFHDNTICKVLPQGRSDQYIDDYYTPRYDTTGNNYVSSTRYCSCRDGFEGNPYLGREGCVDINECSNSTLNMCGGNGTCINTIGGFTCRKRPTAKIVIISVGSAAGGLVLLLGAIFATRTMRKRMKDKHKLKCLALLLEQQLSSVDNGLEKTRLFSSKDLSRATDFYNENRILGRGGQGTVYKGMLTSGRIVAVKKSKKMEEVDLEAFINEVVILSQINHRNVVKLLGCCIETEVPLLVYEFIHNGTLHQHIHDPNEEFPLSWELRVRIAREIAGALAYLHSSSSAPIYHRDIKSSNILLDDKYRAKVSDFGISRSISVDQTHLTTRVQGTFGYLDPEYFQSSQFTEKSDVYSFGVVVVELLTGEKAVSAIRAAEGRGLAAHFLHSMEENQLFNILDARVIKEGTKEEILAIAELSRRCLHPNGKRRPTMKEVAVELEGIRLLEEGNFQQDEGKECNIVEVDESGEFSFTSESRGGDTIIQQL